MIPVSLYIKSVKSFVEETFNFPRKVGLYFVRGVNKVDPEMGANATGKSNLMDCISLVLYGKTLKGERAGNVKNWNTKDKGWILKFAFKTKGHAYVVHRTWNPNSLKYSVDGFELKEIEQSDLETRIIGLPYIAFLYAMIMGQGNKMFLDLDSSSKSKLFSTVFDLDVWLSRSEIVLNEGKVLDSKIRREEKRIQGMESSVVLLGDKLRTYRKKHREINKTLDKELEDYESDYTEVADYINKENDEYERLEDDLKEIISEGSDLADVMTLERQSLESYDEEYNGLQRLLGKERGKFDGAMEHKAFFEKNIKLKWDGECPTCLQRVGVRHNAEKLKELKIKLKQFGDNCSSYMMDINHVEDKRVKTERIINKNRVQIDKLKEEVIGVRTELKNIDRMINQKDKELNSIGDKIDELRKRDNPFSSIIADAKKDIKDFSKSIEKSDKILNEAIENKTYADYWVKGFKEIRLFLLSEYLTQLEIEVNNVLEQLGLYGWSITFETETETKSKTIRKGFHVFILGPSNSKPVPWESWCGGETQRLKIAVNMGLSNLILNKYGITPYFEVWDEPTTYLSDEGVSDLLDSLSNRVLEENKQIFMIDHRTMEYGWFDGVYTVTKDLNGSSIQLTN